MPEPIVVNDYERNTILAALRFWQSQGLTAPQDIKDIANSGDDNFLLDDDDIDNLCERINC